MGTIVVGVDGSDPSREALRVALREAREKQAILRVVLAWHVPPAAYGGIGFAPPYEPHHMFEEGARETLEKTLDAVREEGAGVEIEPVLREGQAASVLIEEAEDADLLVVGSRGHGGFAGLLLGSVSMECAHHAPCPVLIVRERERRR